jgi:hypothetical protein
MEITTNTYLTAADFNQLLNTVDGSLEIIISRIQTTYLQFTIGDPKYTVTIGGGHWRISKGMFERYKAYNLPTKNYGQHIQTTVAVLRRVVKIHNVLA